LLEHAPRLLELVAIEPIEQVETAQPVIVSVKVFRALAANTAQFGLVDIGGNRLRDPLNQTILQGEQLGRRPFALVGVDRPLRLCVGQFRRDAQTIPAPPNAAPEHIAHVERVSDRAKVGRRLAVLQRRTARDDEEIGQRGQRSDHVLDDPIAEIPLLSIGTPSANGSTAIEGRDCSGAGQTRRAGEPVLL
jgi:hypothetical protein